ncbi:MAG: LysM peptidoglycan-binding domain-containing protein [Verrucomicrobiota bacterium]
MKKTKRRKRGGSTSRGLMGSLFKGTQRLPAHVSDEPEWYLDGAEVKLTRVFTIVLILHLVAVGGILAFKMIEKASSPAAITDTSGIDDKQLDEKSKKSAAKELAVSVNAAPVKQAVKEPLKVERRNPVIVADPSRQGMSVYRVSDGETLVSIARDQGVSVAELRRLNDLHTGDKLYAGKWLTVPEKKDLVVGNGKDAVNKDNFAAPKQVLKAKPVGSSATKTAPKVGHVAKVSKPVKAIVAKPVVVKKKNTVPSSNKGGTYTVKSGDNLYSIARKTGVGYSTLMSLNKLDRPELLQVGQVLKISAK